MNTYKFLLSNLSWLMAARFLTRIMALLILPIKTAYLSPKDFGIIAMFTIASSFLGGLYGMGVVSFAGRVIYKYERTDRQKCKEDLGRILIYLVSFSLVGVVVSSFMIKDIFGLFFKDIIVPHTIFFYVPVCMGFVVAIHGFTSNSLLSLQLNKRVFYVEISMFILFVPAQVIGLVFFGFSVWDVIALQLIVQVIIAFLGLWMIKDWISFPGKPLKIFVETMRYSLPMVLMNFGAWFQQSIDKIILNKIVNLNAVGLYSAGVALATNYSFLSRPIATSIKPEISKRLDARDPNFQKQIKEFFMLFFQFSVFLYLGVSLFSKEIVEVLMDVRFHECYRIVPLVVLCLIFGELNGIFHLKFIFRNKTIWFPISMVLGIVLSALLNYLLIPRYDIYGAALANGGTALIIMLFCYIVSQKLHHSNYSLLMNFIPLLITSGLIFAVNTSAIQKAPLFVIKIVIFIIYAIGLDYGIGKISHQYCELKRLIVNRVRYFLSGDYFKQKRV